MQGLFRDAFLLCLCFEVFSAVGAAQTVITSIAGADWLFPGDRKPALNAPLGSSFGLSLSVAVDAAGNLIIGDGDNNMVMRVGADGILTVIAGNGLPTYSGDGGIATDAAILFPSGVAFDSAGNLYVTSGAHRVRRITPAGIISTVAGNGTNGFAGDGGPATAGSLNLPRGIAVDATGNLYVADSLNNRIRRITPAGIITTFAGNGEPAGGGDGGPATTAGLNGPLGVAVDAAGNVYIADTLNGRIRRVTPDGIITSIAGSGAATEEGVPANTAALIPNGVAVDAAGNIYVADFLTSRVRRITPDGLIRTVAGNGTLGFTGDGGPAIAASLNVPGGIAFSPTGDIYIGDGANGRIRRVTPDGIITTVAGNGLFRTTPDGFPAASSAIYLPDAVMADGAGNLYVSEPLRNRVRKIDSSGILTTFAGNGQQGFSGDGGPATAASFFYPSGLFFDRAAGNLYIADELNSRIRRVEPSGIVTTVAGNGSVGFAGDGGPATAASLRFPRAMTLDPFGNLLISDSGNNRIRRVAPDGTISTVVGTGETVASGDGGPAVAAAIANPAGILVDPAGNLFITDTDNHRIRMVTPTDGTITTIAGNGQRGFAGDGGPASAASLAVPNGLTRDPAGNLLIADEGNNLVRRVAADGTIGTVAGTGAGGLSGDGGPATAATLGGPTRITFDPFSNLIISDKLNHRIRAVLAGPPGFQADPATLAFSAASGGTAPPIQRVRLTSSIPGLAFQTAVAMTVGAGWLRATPDAGNMPGAIEVSVDPSSLAPGTYAGNVTITSPVAVPPSITVNVILTVSAAAPPRLGASPRSISFSLVQGTEGTSQSLTVTNEGSGALAFTAAADSPWLSVDPPTGAVTPLTPASLTMRANPANLAPGTYSGKIAVSSAATGEQITVPVTATVTAQRPSLLLSQTGITFIAVVGGGPAPAQSFSVINSGSGSLTWSVRATTLAGGPGWISVTPAAGSSDALTAGGRVDVSVNPAGLPAGQYYAQIDVVSDAADNSPQSAVVVLNLLPGGTDPGPVLQPTGLVFTATAGGVPPGSQTLLISNVSANLLSFTSGKVTEDGGNWLVSLPAQGNVAADQPARVVVQPDITGLAPGVYRGVLTFLFPGAATRTVNVLLILTPAPATLTSGGLAAADACVATRLLPVFTSLGAESTIAAGWPNRMVVRVLDDCGNPLSTGSVVAEFSSGEPPLVLSFAQEGNWTGTWQARDTIGADVTVKATARNPAANIEGTASLTGSVIRNQETPIISAGGVVSAASFAPQAPVAPGSMVAVFGSKFAAKALSASILPLDTDMAGTQVSIAGRLSPLLFASDGQINAIIPFGITTNTRHQIIVRRGNSITVPEPVTVAPAGPAVFTKDQSGKGQGIVVDGSFRLLDAANPTKAGDVVVILCAGLGGVNPDVPAESGAPSSPPANVQTSVSVTIGGVPAQVLFAGLAPGFAGLYQVNAVMPAGVPPGDAVPVIVTSSGLSSSPVTIAAR